MIFIPEDNTFNQCYVVQSEGVIRAYDTTPNYNSSYGYRDYFINSSYIYKEGYGQWSNYSNLPVCLTSSDITHDYWYRLDMPFILLMFLIINIFAIYIPIKLVSRIFKRGVL